MHDFDQELTCTDLLFGAVKKEYQREKLILKDAANNVQITYEARGVRSIKGMSSVGAAVFCSPLMVLFNLFCSSKESMESSFKETEQELTDWRNGEYEPRP